MALFSRKSRTASASGDASSLACSEMVSLHVLPEINQRVTVSAGMHVPVPTRVEDRAESVLHLADPALPLTFGDLVLVSWERDEAWFSLETRILAVDDLAHVPTVQVATTGRLARYDERRTDVRRAVDLPLDMRIGQARVLQLGRTLAARTTEVSGRSVCFTTSAPFAPGDVVEARIGLGDDSVRAVSARLRIVRVDHSSTSWSQQCVAVFEEVLRSDLAQLLAFVDVVGTPADGAPPVAADAPSGPGAATPPSVDGVGGRDEPVSLGTIDDVLAWLRRRR